MAIAQRLVFVFEWKGAVHSNRRGSQLTQPLEGKVVVCGQAMTCLSLSNSWVTHSNPLFNLSSPFLAHLRAVTFRMSYTSPFPGCTYTNGVARKCRHSSCSRVLTPRIQFSRCWENVRRAGIDEFIGLGATWDWMMLYKPWSREFVQLSLILKNTDLLVIVWRENIWIGSCVISLCGIRKKLVVVTFVWLLSRCYIAFQLKLNLTV
jgi:hypothetical protein